MNCFDAVCASLSFDGTEANTGMRALPQSGLTVTVVKLDVGRRMNTEALRVAAVASGEPSKGAAVRPRVNSRGVVGSGVVQCGSGEVGAVEVGGVYGEARPREPPPMRSVAPQGGVDQACRSCQKHSRAFRRVSRLAVAVLGSVRKRRIGALTPGVNRRTGAGICAAHGVRYAPAHVSADCPPLISRVGLTSVLTSSAAVCVLGLEDSMWSTNLIPVGVVPTRPRGRRRFPYLAIVVAVAAPLGTGST
jgi:hypothetical protein